MNLQITLNRAVQLLQAGQAQDAESLLRQILKSSPDHPDVLHLLGLAAKRLSNIGQAESYLRRSLELKPGQPAVWNNLGNVLKQAGRTDQAIDAYQRAVDIAPQYLDAWRNLGITLASCQQHETAVRAFDRALALAPDDADSLNGKGLSLQALNRPDEAEECHAKAVAVSPQSIKALNNLGNLLRDRGKDQDASEVFLRALKTSPEASHLRIALAGAYYNLGRFAESEALLQEVIQAEPSNREAHGSLTTVYFTTGRSAEIPRMFERTLSRHPELAPIWEVYAETLWQLGEQDAALSVVRRAIDACGNRPRLRLIHGRILSSSGDPGGAIDILAQSSEIPSDLHSLFAVERARANLRLGAFAEGAADLLKTAEMDRDNYTVLAHLESLWRLAGDERALWLLDYHRFVKPIEVPVPDGYSTHAAFNDELTAVLTKLHVGTQHPIDQTLRGGTQTFGNLFRRTEPVIAALKNSILETLNAYIANFRQDEDHPFLRHIGRPLEFKGSWSVRLQDQGFHVHHYHPQGWISSAYYVALPDSVADPSKADGNLEFGMPPVAVPTPVQPVMTIQPRVGTLALFPSYCLHGTKPFRGSKPRLTVAFDMARN